MPHLHDPFSRYLPSESVDPVGPNDINGLGDASGSVGNGIHTDPEMYPKPVITKIPTDPTDPQPQYGADEGHSEKGQGVYPLEKAELRESESSPEHEVEEPL